MVSSDDKKPNQTTLCGKNQYDQGDQPEEGTGPFPGCCFGTWQAFADISFRLAGGLNLCCGFMRIGGQAGFRLRLFTLTGRLTVKNQVQVPKSSRLFGQSYHEEFPTFITLSQR